MGDTSFSSRTGHGASLPHCAACRRRSRRGRVLGRSRARVPRPTPLQVGQAQRGQRRGRRRRRRRLHAPLDQQKQVLQLGLAALALALALASAHASARASDVVAAVDEQAAPPLAVRGGEGVLEHEPAVVRTSVATRRGDERVCVQQAVRVLVREAAVEIDVEGRRGLLTVEDGRGGGVNLRRRGELEGAALADRVSEGEVRRRRAGEEVGPAAGAAEARPSVRGGGGEGGGGGSLKCCGTDRRRALVLARCLC